MPEQFGNLDGYKIQNSIQRSNQCNSGMYFPLVPLVNIAGCLRRHAPSLVLQNYYKTIKSKSNDFRDETKCLKVLDRREEVEDLRPLNCNVFFFKSSRSAQPPNEEDVIMVPARVKTHLSQQNIQLPSEVSPGPSCE